MACRLGRWSVILICIFAPWLSSVSAASLSCMNPVWDFDAIDGLDEITHTFVLTNAASTPVIIDDIQTPCSCTTYQLKMPVVPPGKSVCLSVSFNPRGRTGETEKAVRIITRGNSVPLLLTVKGKIVPPVKISPRLVVISGIRGAVFTKDITIRFSNSTGIIGIKSGVDGLAVEQIQLSEREVYVLRVEGTIPEKGGRSSIEISTDNETCNEITVPILVRHRAH